MPKNLFATKTVDDILADAERANAGGLKRALGAFDLTLFGVGAIVGAGIFGVIGTAAAGNASRPGAGPSLILSFVITAVICSFTALCYAELAAAVPISGSAYTYAYATLGELVAWTIGWDLILEYAISNVAIAISWANYMRVLLHGVGVHVPAWLCTDWRTARHIPGLMQAAPHLMGVPIVFNALAMLVVAALTALVVVGIRESVRVNTLIVLVKMAVLAFFAGAAAWFSSGATAWQNWHPFFVNGWTGTCTGAAIVFFAYVGFDSLSTVAEETKNPGRNMPIGIIASLVVCTVLYLGVTAVFTGILPYDILAAEMSNEQAEPLTLALRHVAPNATWAGTIIALGAVIAETAAILVYQIAQPRILYVMARDGLLPRVFAAVHPRFKTPHVTTLMTGVAVAAMAGFASIDEMVDLTNIGTLFAFTLVCVGVPVLRHTDPRRHRPFKLPLGPYLIPALGASSCVGLMWFLPPASWWRFVGWLALGVGIYVLYGFCHSTLAPRLGRPARLTGRLRITGSAWLAMACGLFVMPHDAGMGALLHAAALGATRHGPPRALVGVVVVALSATLLVGMALVGRRARLAGSMSPRV